VDAFDFNRIEDVTDDPDAPGTIYVAETGRAHQEVTHGRVYRLEVDPRAPTAGHDLRDPRCGDRRRHREPGQPGDLGLGARDPGDRNWEASGFNRVLVYDLASATLTEMARADPDQDLVDERGPGVWETSAAVDVSDVFGPGWWLLNVQAHYTEMSVPDQGLEPDSGTGEGGQLTLLFVPGT
jgi:hypothetical protein